MRIIARRPVSTGFKLSGSAIATPLGPDRTKMTTPSSNWNCLAAAFPAGPVSVQLTMSLLVSESK